MKPLRVDGYLSRKAQEVFPRAIVLCQDDGNLETWFIRDAFADDLGLGATFRDARDSVGALVRAQKAKS